MEATPMLHHPPWTLLAGWTFIVLFGCMVAVRERVSMPERARRRADRPVNRAQVLRRRRFRHTGMIYRAAGWKPTVIAEASRGNHHQWNNKSRARSKGQSDAAKRRWEKQLRNV
jgi:hypothetical protein